jgi:enoyl-CoA hydratase/carnithine racemase
MATLNQSRTFETVRFETKGPLCHLILNRPEKLNAALSEDFQESARAFVEKRKPTFKGR